MNSMFWTGDMSPEGKPDALCSLLVRSTVECNSCCGEQSAQNSFAVGLDEVRTNLTKKFMWPPSYLEVPNLWHLGKVFQFLSLFLIIQIYFN